jgi:hypothetical protein
MSNQSPPKWAPNAIPTIFGWADPKTGELLVSKKGLSNVVSNYRRNSRPSKDELLSTIDVTLDISTSDDLVESTFVDLEVEPAELEDAVEKDESPVLEEVKPRRPGRPKKKV